MTKFEFFEQLENFVKHQIFENFISNEVIEFNVCFRTHIELYLKQNFKLENDYLLSILVKQIEIDIFEEYHSITEKLQDFQYKCHKIDNAFFKLIDVLQENDYSCYSSKTIITDKLNNFF
jgi:hypothetical protein